MWLVGSGLWQVPAFAQTNAISSPSTGSIIAGIITVTGTAIDPEFLRYELSFFQEFNPGAGWIVFGEGNQPVVDGVLTLWDTTVGRNINAPIFPDGAYRLRLRVVRQDFNYDEFFVTNITVQNEGSLVTPSATFVVPVVTDTVTPIPPFTNTPIPQPNETISPTPAGTATETPTLTPSVTVLSTSLPAPTRPLVTPLPSLTLLPGGQNNILPSLTPFASSTPLPTAASNQIDPVRPTNDEDSEQGGLLQQLNQINFGQFGSAFLTGVKLVVAFFLLMGLYLMFRWLWRLIKRLVWGRLFNRP